MYQTLRAFLARQSRWPQLLGGAILLLIVAALLQHPTFINHKSAAPDRPARLAPDNAGKNIESNVNPSRLEMALGTDHLEHLVSLQQPSTSPRIYKLPPSLPLNTFALEGSWQFSADQASLTAAPGKIKVHFNAAQVNVLAHSDRPNPVFVLVDGKIVNTLTIKNSHLYPLFQSHHFGDHVLELDIPEGSIHVFTLTFD